MIRVILIEHPRRTDLDMSGLKEYGEVTYIFGSTDRRHSIFNAAAFGSDVLRKLREMRFDPTLDYFALVGSLTPVALTLAAIMSEYPRANVLLYDSAYGRYLSKEIGKEAWDVGSVQEADENSRRAV